MLGINCLLSHPELIDNLKQIVHYTALDLAETNGTGLLPEVYKAMIKAGIEVDMQTVSKLYEEVVDLNNIQFSTQDEIDAINMQPLTKLASFQAAELRTIGRNSPVVEAVSRIVTMAQRAIETNTDTTIQRLMQDRLMKVAKRIISNSPEGKAMIRTPIASDPFEALREALLLHSEDNDFDGLGVLRNAKVAFDDLKKEFGEVADALDTLDAVGKDQIKQIARVLEGASYDLLLSSSEIRKILHEVLKEAGFTKVTKGTVSLDWHSVVTKKGRDVMGSIEMVLEEKGFTDEDIAMILPSLEREYKLQLAQRIKDQFKNTVSDRGRLERFATLAADNPGAFNNAQNNALLSALNIGALTQSNVNVIQAQLVAYRRILQHPAASFSPTFINSIETSIRNQIERAQEQSGGNLDWLKFARNFQLSSQWASSLLLANIGNVPENALSGTANLLDALMSNPQQAIEMIRRGLVTGATVAAGGVRVGKEISNFNTINVNLDDRTSAQTLGYKNWKVWANLWQRASLSATDALFGQAVMSGIEMRAIKFILKSKANLTNSEANKVLNEMFFKNTREIEAIADMMIAQLIGLGLDVGEMTKARIINELMLANMRSQGQVWEDTLALFEASPILSENKIAAKLKDVKMQDDILLRLRAAADAVRARAMGHAPDTLAGKMMLKIYQGTIEESIEGAQKRGERKKQAGLEIGRGLLGNTLFARRGGLNWTFLQMQRSMGLPLIITLLWDVLGSGVVFGNILTKSRAKELLFEIDNAPDQQVFDKELNEFMSKLENTYAVRQRLIRETLGPLVTGFISVFILHQMSKNCEEDPDCMLKKFTEWKDRGYLSSFEKWLPYILNNYIYDHFNEFGKPKPKAEQPTGIADFMSKTYGLKGMGPMFKNLYAYLEKNRALDDNLIGSAWKAINPPDYIQPYDREAYSKAQVGNIIGSALGIRHLKFWDVNANRVDAYKFALGDVPEKSVSEMKAERKEIYPQGILEGILKNTLTNGMMRWYVTKYGHGTPEAKNSLNTEVLSGIGPKRMEYLKVNHKVENIGDLKSKSIDDLSEMTFLNDEGKYESMFSFTKSVNIYNEIHKTGFGKVDVSSMKMGEESKKLLQDMGYFSIGENNIEAVKENLWKYIDDVRLTPKRHLKDFSGGQNVDAKRKWDNAQAALDYLEKQEL